VKASQGFKITDISENMFSQFTKHQFREVVGEIFRERVSEDNH